MNAQSLTLADIQQRAESFLEWPAPDQKQVITLTSATLFAYTVCNDLRNEIERTRMQIDELAAALDDVLDLFDPDDEDPDAAPARTLRDQYRPDPNLALDFADGSPIT